MTGHGGVEYCDRPIDENGRTCKEIRAFQELKRARATTRCSRFTAGSTRSGLLGSGPAGSPRTSSTPEVRGPERKKQNVRKIKLQWRNLDND